MKVKGIKRKIIKVFMIIIVFFLIIFLLKLYKIQNLQKLSYDKTAANLILDIKIYKEIMNLGYSNTINNCIRTNDFNKKYLSYYKKIEYNKQNNFCNNINKLIEKKYTAEEINNIIKNGDNADINEFVKKDYIENINNYLKYDFAKTKNIDRYIKYYDDKKESYEKTIIYVNIGLDKEFYTDVEYNKDNKDTVLVNKYTALDKDYIPNNLRLINKKYWIDNEAKQASDVAASAFEKMASEAALENIYIMVNSSYRSYSDQEKIFNEYKRLYGENYALNYAAKPGFSEHQTGLCFDIASKNNNIFSNSKEYKWVKNNAYKYGFIERYPKDKQNITGYKYESWHYRYVGEQIAKYIYENNITYEEYYYKYLNN